MTGKEQSEREEKKSVVYTKVTEPASDFLDTEDSGDGPFGRKSTVISSICGYESDFVVDAPTAVR